MHLFAWVPSWSVQETTSLFALLWRARMNHRTRQESTAPRRRFLCDLTVARPPVKVAFANTRLILGVLLEQHEHEQKLNTPK